VSVEHQAVVWPWSGWFAVRVAVADAAATFEGVVRGRVTCRVSAVDAQGVFRAQLLELPLAVRVVPTPPRQRRLLWDQFHSINYPSGYFPRDNLKVPAHPPPPPAPCAKAACLPSLSQGTE
jgi:membrane-bound transcription factor site-1 protease